MLGRGQHAPIQTLNLLANLRRIYYIFERNKNYFNFNFKIYTMNYIYPTFFIFLVNYHEKKPYNYIYYNDYVEFCGTKYNNFVI